LHVDEVEIKQLMDLPTSIHLSIAVSIVATVAVGYVWGLLNKRVRLRVRQLPNIILPRASEGYPRNTGPQEKSGRIRVIRKGNESIQRLTTDQVFINYQAWNGQLPMSRQVHDQLRALANNPTPVSAVLLSTNPPTIKITRTGPTPIVTELKTVTSLENLQTFPTSDRSTIGTFHNHLKDSQLLEHDVGIFEKFDKWAGPKYHIIGSPKGLRFYCVSNQNPAVQPAGK
jgi:hypothetical protein